MAPSLHVCFSIFGFPLVLLALYTLMQLYHSCTHFWLICAFYKIKRPKGQQILKKHCHAKTSPKKRTNEFFFSILKSSYILGIRVSNKPAQGQDRPALSIQEPQGPRPMTPRGLKSSTPPRPSPSLRSSRFSRVFAVSTSESRIQ